MQFRLVDARQHRAVDVLEVDVADARRCPGDQRHGVHACVREVPGVEAQVEVGLHEEPLDLVLELEEAPGMRVHDRAQPVVARDRRDARDGVEQAPPARAGEPERGIGAAGGRRPRRPRPVDDHEDPPAGRADRRAGAPGHGRDRPVPRRVVQVVEDERADGGQAAGPERRAQLARRLGQIADRPQLERAEPGRGDLVENQRPRQVVRRAGEVDAPGDRPGGEADAHRYRCALRASRWAAVRARVSSDVATSGTPRSQNAPLASRERPGAVGQTMTVGRSNRSRASARASRSSSALAATTPAQPMLRALAAMSTRTGEPSGSRPSAPRARNSLPTVVPVLPKARRLIDW
jgi:hypothetical protein